jgi:hypothetical protein
MADKANTFILVDTQWDGNGHGNLESHIQVTCLVTFQTRWSLISDQRKKWPIFIDHGL